MTCFMNSGAARRYLKHCPIRAWRRTPCRNPQTPGFETRPWHSHHDSWGVMTQAEPGRQSQKANMSRLSAFAAAALVLAVATAIDVAAAQSTRPSLLYTRADIQGADLGCNQFDYGQSTPLPYCKLCNGLANAEDTCKINPSCKGITSDGYCYFLKSATSPRVYREGYYVVVPTASTADVAKVINCSNLTG